MFFKCKTDMHELHSPNYFSLIIWKWKLTTKFLRQNKYNLNSPEGNNYAKVENLQLIIRVLLWELIWHVFPIRVAQGKKKQARWDTGCSFVFSHLVAIIHCFAFPLLRFLCILQPLSVWGKKRGKKSKFSVISNIKGGKIGEFVKWKWKYFIVQLSEKLCSLLGNLLPILSPCRAHINRGI